jgi:FAD/FMN-containing dehydrogenase
MNHHHAVNELSRRLSGYICEPGSPGYTRALDLDNGRARLPAAYVVRARSAADIVLTIAFAQRTDLPMTVCGGGHSAAGYCLSRGGVVLDLSLMKAMRLDDRKRLLHVEMGATWRDVYRFLAESNTGLIPIGGGCLTVGLPGFLLGGGYSFLSRSYGLGSDNVTSIDLLTADGRHHTLTADVTDPLDRDLFWACRGGGGGNFGVATAMTLRLHKPAAPTLLGGQLSYPLERAHEVIGAYNEWIETLPDAMAVYGYVGMDPDPAEPTRKIPAFRITPVYNGPYAQGADLLAPMLRLKPLEARLYDMTLPTWESTMGNSTLVRDRLAYIRSGVLPPGGLSPDVVSAITDAMADSPSPDSFVVWTHGGGKVAHPDGTSPGPYPHRSSRYVFELKSIWSGEAGTRANVEWAYDLGEALRPALGGAYLNYIDPLLSDWAHAYYGASLERLREIKKKADPEGFFSFQQSVDSTFEPNAARPLDLSPLNRTIL